MATEDRFDAEKATELVRQLAAMIEHDRGRSIHEAQTVAKYVTPFLEAIGWTVADDRLIHQYPVKQGKVDIALLAEGKPVVFVEAKRLKENLSLKDKEAAQALDYGFKSGTDWCVLTNGERYEIYNAFAKVDHARKLVTSFNILNAAKSPESELPKLRLLSFEGVTLGELEKFAKETFSRERLREVLTELPDPVMSALCAELKSCGMAKGDVKLGLALLLKSEVLPPPPPPPEPDEADDSAWGPRGFRLPLRREGNTIIVGKYRPLKDDVAPARVSLASLEAVARAANALARQGKPVTGAAVHTEPSVPKSYGVVIRSLGALYVAGAIVFERAGQADVFRIAEDLDAEGMVQRVLGKAEAIGEGKDPGVGADRKQQFKWVLDSKQDGSFVMDCRYLADESKSFRVSGKRISPNDDFRPARKELFTEIYEHIKPLFAELPDGRVRARTWSGVHKVYPSKTYGKT